MASSDRNLASLGQLNADIAQGPNLINRAMSAFGTKRTCHRCPRISVINPLLSISASLFIVTSPLLVPSLVRETKFKVWVNSDQSIGRSIYVESIMDALGHQSVFTTCPRKSAMSALPPKCGRHRVTRACPFWGQKAR